MRKFGLGFVGGILLAASFGISASEYEQLRKAPVVHPLVWESFALSDVQLTDSYFKQAMDLNKEYLLSLDVDRLIPHVRRNAGLQPKGENYGGWEKGGGCSWGHYMSALSMMYASTSDTALLDKLDYLLSQLEECQQQCPDGWFITGEHAKEGYRQLLEGNVHLNKPDETGQPWNYNQNGNSWYCIHKIMAGLRDAYMYAHRDKALRIMTVLADYISNVVLNSNRDLFQSILSVEQGGMNEVFADIYRLTGDSKYLRTTERFNHINVIYPVANGEDVLFGRHANDQIPKFLGVAKQYEFTHKDIYHQAAVNFWNMVIKDHTLAIGGNSCYERFGLPGEQSKRLDYTSAETCNTYNMLKLTRQLFMLDGNPMYLDYYEHALYNHILASQDPDMQGCVTYYTSLLPGSFKQYSTPFDSFWCCVGTGMENHSKYGESIYFKNNQDILVNLFIPSRLTWKEKGLCLTMETAFPESDDITVKIDRAGSFTGSLMFRNPYWAAGDCQITINDKPAQVEMNKGAFIRLLEPIDDGDVVKLVVRRGLHFTFTDDEPHFGSVMYGPILLSGGFGSEGMPDDRVSDNRAFREQLPEKNIPMLVGPLADTDKWIVRTSQRPLKFEVRNGGGEKNLELIPYFRMHHQRHSVYWKIYSEDEFAARKRAMTDEVIVGDESSEKAHALSGERDSLCWHDYFWAKNTMYRMAENGWFSYKLKTDKKETRPYKLICRFWGDEPATSEFDILVDGKVLTTVNLHRHIFLSYVDEVYTIPAEWTQGKDRITVTFRAADGHKAGGLFGLKITADADFR